MTHPLPWLASAAVTCPERMALITPTQTLTYRQLELASGPAAAALGDVFGREVAIALPAGSEFVVALHACLRAGAVAVPVDLRLNEGERAHVTRNCVRTIDTPLPWVGEPRPWAALARERIAVVMHTSGTSGQAKRVELSYDNFLWSALGSAVALGLDPDERWLCTLPLAHVGGLSILMRSAIYGSTAILHERFDVDEVLAALRQDDVTLISLVPTTLARLLDAGLRPTPRLRCALIGGAPLAGSLIARARAHRVPISQTYGLTEACSQVTTQIAGEAGEDAGPPLFCTRVEIDPADGEIIVGGPTVAGGKTLRTGDIGEMRDGRLRVLGRKSEVIVSGGENITPAEVEDALASHPAVIEAGVHGVADPQWGEAVRAVVVVSVAVSSEELRAHCAQHLARFKLPKEIVVRREPLPRTASGKLLRRQL